MNNNQNIQKSKPDPKGKAIASVILGKIGLILTLFAIFVPFFYYGVIVVYGIFAIAIVGLILGIKGLSSRKKNWAIIGIIECLISLILIFWRF